MTRRPPKSPLFPHPPLFRPPSSRSPGSSNHLGRHVHADRATLRADLRSEEHTSELQSPLHLLFHLFFLNDTAPPEISPLPPPAALPTSEQPLAGLEQSSRASCPRRSRDLAGRP